MTTKETYDIIASDPLDVWVKGTASIYTEDYFRAVKAHLNPGGFFTLYVPLYQSATRPPGCASRRRSSRVFPNGTVWANTQLEGQGYDLVLMGQNSPLKVDISAVQARLDRPDYAPVRVSLDQIGFGFRPRSLRQLLPRNSQTWPVGCRGLRSTPTAICG